MIEFFFGYLLGRSSSEPSRPMTRAEQECGRRALAEFGAVARVALPILFLMFVVGGGLHSCILAPLTMEVGCPQRAHQSLARATEWVVNPACR